MANSNDHKYDDIIDLPHHVSSKRPQMSLYDRAAQFAAFKALTGYENRIAEAARLTGERIELDDASLSLLNGKIQILQDEIKSRPNITSTYFVPDKKKDVGEYVAVNGDIKRIDEVERVIIFSDGRTIQIDDVIDLQSALFTELERGYLDI